MDRATFTKIVEKHSGTVTASNDEGTQFRVKFPLLVRAANFYDQMAGNVALADWNPLSSNPNIVIVNL